jgi:hypothetical protein
VALIPLYGVGISGATHIFAFDLLRRDAAAKSEPTARWNAAVTQRPSMPLKDFSP